MKVASRRKKWWLWGSIGVLVPLLLVVAVMASDEPYRFMHGAEYQGTWEYSLSTAVVISRSPRAAAHATVVSHTASSRFWISRSLHDVASAARSELLPKGWVDHGYGPGTIVLKGSTGELLQIYSDQERGTFVVISRTPTQGDKLRAWLWRLTHQGEFKTR